MTSPANKGQTYQHETYTQDEINKVLKQLKDDRYFTNVRDRTLIIILWQTGLRIAEALALRPNDIRFNHNTIHVRKGKGRKERRVAINEMALAILDKWLEYRNEMLAERVRLGKIAKSRKNQAPLFCTHNATPIPQSNLRRKFIALQKKAKLDKRFHAHALRHTHASELGQEGYSLVDIRDQLGHANSATTDRYMQQINPAKRIARIAGRTM